MFLFRPALIALLCVLPLLLPSGAGAKTDRKAQKKKIEQGIKSFHINIQKLEEGISLQRSQIKSSAEQERSLLTELEQINTSLQKQIKKFRKLKLQMETQQKEIKKKEKDLLSATNAKQTVQAHLQKRIKSYYKMGTVGIANIMFSSESMPQMLSFRDSFISIIDYDATLLEKYRESIKTIERSKEKLSLEKTILDDFIQAAKTKEQKISLIKKEKETLLVQIKTQKELHERAVKEMEKAADGLASSLEALKKRNKLFDKGFLLDKGQHPAPVHGTILALYGQQRENRLGIKGKSTGITISAPGINQVEAIFEGEVRYSSYLHGYGNTIIIDHGYQYFSIISRLEKLTKQKGDKVFQGETIGYTGDTATLMDDGIYFEVRHGSTPLNPMKWIDSTGLILPKKSHPPAGKKDSI